MAFATVKISRLGLQLALVFFAVSVGAMPCDSPGEKLFFGRPASDGPPTEVSVGIFVVDLMEIDTLRQSFAADFYLSVRWRDQRLDDSGYDDRCPLDIEDIWIPGIALVNQRPSMRRIEESLQREDDGRLHYYRRFNGELQAELDVRDFPNDSQTLPISVASLHPATEVNLVIDEKTGSLHRLTIAGWTGNLVEARTEVLYVEPLGRELVQIHFPLDVRRVRGFYIWKMLVPISLIVLMAWSVFWLDPEKIPPRIGISTATIFSLIAFQFSLGGILPPVAYLTRADQFVIGSMLLVFAALGIVIVTTNLFAKGRCESADRVNRWSRWSYITLLAMLVATIFLK